MVYAFIKCELYLVEVFRANILIGNDILAPEGFVINIGLGHAIVGSCVVKITIRARQKGPLLRKKLFAKKDGLVPPRFEVIISLLPIPLPDNRGFLFHPTAQTNLTLFADIIHHDTTKVLVQNTSEQPLRISRCQKLGHVVDICYNNCFFANAEVILNSAIVPPLTAPFLEHKPSLAPTPTDPSMERTLDNWVKVYGDKHAATLLARLVAKFPTIWESQGFVQIPPERWITVPLKPGWESKVSSIKPRIYPFGNEAQKVVDNTFDEMHRQARLEYTTDPTLFSCPVFVIYKIDSHGKKKGRAVVDIRKLNNLVLLDSYPLLLQSEIIANVQGCTNLAMLNAASFFYQWQLYPDHCFMSTIITHRGQKTFHVPIMGYINLVAYVQREINNILHNIRAWAQAYIDDIICRAKSLPDLLDKLRILFEIFLAYNISISPTKSYLNYPNVVLLGQQVDSLSLTTLEQKLKAIKFLTYPDTLGALEYYLGLTGYLRNYIHFYAQLPVPLQDLKTMLLQEAPLAGQQCRAYASRTKLGPPTPQELASFLSIQEALAQPSTLVNHNPEKILWIDLDASKKFDFGAIVFHTASGEAILERLGLSASTIQSILFFFRLLTPAKRNYWPTKLKIAGFVWVVKKIRHIIESSKSNVII